MSVEVIEALGISVQTHTRKVRLYFDLWDEMAGEVIGVKNVTLDASDTFGDLKMTMLEKFAGKDFCRLSHRYELRVQFRSFSRLSKRALIPHCKDSVLRVIEAEENRWAGMIYLVLTDMRKLPRASARSSESQSSSPNRPRLRTSSTVSIDGAPVAYPPQSNLKFTTDWFISREEIDGIDVLAKLNQYILDTGTRSGRLQKFQFCKDTWREEHVIVDENRIWFLQSKDYSGAYSYLDLTPNLTVFCENDSNIITISNITMRRGAHVNAAKDFGVLLKFRAQTKEQAMEWQSAIQFRSEAFTLENENGTMIMMEKFMENEEKICFEESLSKVKELTQFEGMLSNFYLREQFRAFLESQYSDEFLKFWEYAEDYRR